MFEKLTAHFESKRLKIAVQVQQTRYITTASRFSFRKSILTTAFVLGLRDENISWKLLAEKDFTLDKAITTAQSLQVADKEAHEMALQPTARMDAINAH